MFIIYEENGKFRFAHILQENEQTLHIETPDGKHAKIKRQHVIIQYEQADRDNFMAVAKTQAKAIDIATLWELAPQEPFYISDFAHEYYGHTPTITENMTLLLAIHEAPCYFHRQQKGYYKAATADILQASLLAEEKKRQIQEQIQQWTADLMAGIVPPEIQAVATSFLDKPNKNSSEWKAFAAVMKAKQYTVFDLLLKLKVYPHPLALMRATFMHQYFPHGTAIEPAPLPPCPTLATADTVAYSIDSADTTEIDDALSVQHQHDDVYRFGVHIAAPALIVKRDSALDQIARKRASTVYTPGQKIPMQQEDLIEAFSLKENGLRPVLSLYVTVDLATGEILEESNKVEQIEIAANLRTEDLYPYIDAQKLAQTPADIPYPTFFQPLWRLTQILSEQRTKVRGYPENLSNFEFNFFLDGDPTNPDAIVHLIPRQRTNPVDMIVAEMMILANHRWALYLNQTGVAAIYRSQQHGRTRMSTRPNPHEYIGVSHYAWCTSPLRRYVDLVNQIQLIDAIEYGITAKLKASFQYQDLLKIIAHFDDLYTAYSNYQRDLERYWAIRWLQQNNIQTCEALTVKDNLVKLCIAPLFVGINKGINHFPRNTRIKVQITHIDIHSLKVKTKLLEVLHD